MPAANRQTARRAKVHEGVAARIQRLIDRKLKPGDKLPTQRALAAMFKVTPGSVKDAVRRLELMGLVEPRSGRGTTVRESAAEFVIVRPKGLLHNPQLLSQLLDFRKILEPPLAARAAREATPVEVAEIERIVQLQGRRIKRGEPAIDEDANFHYAIAVASHNSVVLQLLNMLMDLLRESRQRSLQVEGRPAKSVAGHRRILAAIKKRDPSAAESAMLTHLREIEAILLSSPERAPGPSTSTDR
jgi:GntR family transcriptional repressor for pyruvate dehydrogenase complex